MNVQQKSIAQYIEDLKESNELGQLLLDNAGEALFFYSLEGKLIYVNPAFEKITGYTTQELYEKNFIPYIHPDDQEWTMKLWQGLFKGEMIEDIEYRIVKKDGEIRWCSSSWEIVSDNDGRQIGIQGKQQDITKRKAIEQQLKESEQYNRKLFEESTIGLALCRTNGGLIDINPAYASILGRTVEETLKLSYWDITPEKYAAEEQVQLKTLEKTGRYGPYEKEYIHADGHLVPVSLTGQVLEKDGETFIWSSVEDITERKHVEETLRKSEERYRSVVEQQTEMICRFQPDFTLTFINKAYCQYFEKSESELLGLNFLTLIPEEAWESLHQHFASFTQEHSVQTQEHPVIAPDGSQRWQQWANQAFFDESGKILEFQAAGRDITERKQVEEALRESEERLRLLVEQAGFHLWSIDRNLKFTQSLGGGLTNLGLRPNEVVGQTLYQFFQTESPEFQPIKAHLQALEGKQVNYESEWQGRYYQSQVTPQYDANGMVVGCIGLAVDTTYLKQAEEAVRRSEALERLATGAPLTEILTALVTSAEKHSPDSLCSVLLLDNDGKRLRHGAEPA